MSVWARAVSSGDTIASHTSCMRIIQLTLSALLLTTPIFAAELPEATSQQLLACIDGEYTSCEKVLVYFIDQKDTKNTALVADYMCLDKGFKFPKSQITSCYIAGEYYLIDENNLKKALGRFKVSCAAADDNSTTLSNQVFASTCTLVAAIEKDVELLDEEIASLSKICTEWSCFYNIAVALAIAGSFGLSVEYIEKAVKAGNNSRKEMSYFARYPKIAASNKYRKLIKKFTR